MKIGVEGSADCLSGPVLTRAPDVPFLDQDSTACCPCTPGRCARNPGQRRHDRDAAFLDPARQREARRKIESEFP